MTGLIVLIVLIFVGGIILLSGKSPHKKRSREQYLQELTKFLGGTLEPIADQTENRSFRIGFKFEGEDFIYEDLEKQGFKDKVNVAYLKIGTPNKFSLTFSEKKRTTKIRTDIFLASEISSQQAGKNMFVEAPKFLNDMNVHTNDVGMANRIFEDGKAAALLKQFKNIDTRGYPFLSLVIVDGVLTLEFSAIHSHNPSLDVLYSNLPMIENYIEGLLVFVKELKKIS